MVDYEIRLGRADGKLSCLFIVAQWSDAAAIALGRAIKRHTDARLEIWRGDLRVHFETRDPQLSSAGNPADPVFVRTGLHSLRTIYQHHLGRLDSQPMTTGLVAGSPQ